MAYYDDVNLREFRNFVDFSKEGRLEMNVESTEHVSLSRGQNARRRENSIRMCPLRTHVNTVSG
jgi:hypothetical protein